MLVSSIYSLSLSLSLSPISLLLQTGKSTSPTKSYLEFLTLPNDDNTKVDLRQVATVTLAHLDRLAQPYTNLDIVRALLLLQAWKLVYDTFCT